MGNPIGFSCALSACAVKRIKHGYALLEWLRASFRRQEHSSMTKHRQDGRYLLVLGIAFFVLFGSVLKITATNSMADIKVVYNGSRCLLQGCDPYHEAEMREFYEAQHTESLSEINSRKTYTVFCNLPATILITAPFALLPWGLASVLWMILTGAAMALASWLMWDIGARYAPILSGGLIALLLANSSVVLGNGNSAGIVVALCVIAVWCFFTERCVPAGILCLAISLAIKPHDSGLIWFYLLLAGGIHRKRALQTLAVTAALSLAAAVWVAHVAPNWMPELRSNLAALSAHGENNDPGPDGLTTTSKSMNVMTSLQAAVSVVSDDSRVYDLTSYLICGALLMVGLAMTLQSRGSPALNWYALAAVASITLLATYHRAYDAKLLLLAVPACAMLWAEGGLTGKIALIVNTAGLVFSGEIPMAILVHHAINPQPGRASLLTKVLTLPLTRPTPLVLLAMSIFYLWIYVRRAAQANCREATQRETPSPAAP